MALVPPDPCAHTGQYCGYKGVVWALPFVARVPFFLGLAWVFVCVVFLAVVAVYNTFFRGSDDDGL